MGRCVMREIVREWIERGDSETALVIDCEKYDSDFQELEPLVGGITDFAVEFRYPGENATPEEVREALNKTIRVRKFLALKIQE